jgi:hypothetical protein
MASRNRGKKKPKLRDLSRALPTREEADALYNQLVADAQHPVVVAITGAALLEYELEMRIRERIPKMTDAQWEALTGNEGPLSTFYTKISLAEALRLISGPIKDALNTVRAIRNAFAHAKRTFTFDHELIRKELSSITVPTKNSKRYRDFLMVKAPPGSPEGVNSNQERFGCLCLIISTHMLLHDNHRLLKNRNRRAKQKRFTLGDAASLSPVQGYFGRLFEAGQTLNPNQQVLPQSPLATPFPHQAKDREK